MLRLIILNPRFLISSKATNSIKLSDKLISLLGAAATDRLLEESAKYRQSIQESGKYTKVQIEVMVSRMQDGALRYAIERLPQHIETAYILHVARCRNIIIYSHHICN